MRYDVGRRAFITVLTVCLAALVLMFARRSVDAQMAKEQRYPRVNGNVSLEVGEDGVLYFSGVGVLYSEDVFALIHHAGLKKRLITDIIVGDGITEIGYMSFYQMYNLTTLKLGKDVTRVGVRGIGCCPDLKFLWLPPGLQSVARDFLYDCDSCRIITSGDSDCLPRMDNVDSEERILTKVDSLEALTAACPKEALPSALKKWWS